MTDSSPTAHFTPDRLRHSLFSQGGAQVFKLLVSIAIGGWMARYLGPKNLGILTYATALVGLLGPLGSLGVNGSLSALLCEQRQLPGLLGSALLIELIGTLVLGLVLIPFAWAAKDPVVAGLIGLGIVGNLMNSFEVFEIELLNRQRGTQLARISAIQIFIVTVLSIIALLVEAPLLVFGILPVIQAAIRACLLAVASQASKPLVLLKQASWVSSLALIKRGLPLLLGGLSVMLYMRSDLVMLEWLRGPEEVGQYSVAARVAESMHFLPVVLSKTFLPRIGRGSGDFKIDPELRQLYRSAWFLGVGMMLVSMLVLPYLVPFIFGGDFLPAKAALVWLGPAAFAVATGCASEAWLNTQGHQKLIALRSVIGAFTNIMLNLFLIPRMGITGAALATSVSQLASVYFIAIFRREISGNFVYLAFPFRNALTAF